VGGLLLPPVHERSDRPAVRIDGRELSYRDLHDAAAAVARSLKGTGGVAVWAEPALETCVAVVGATAAGAPALRQRAAA
jgi:malonyl-CoA/methylmalonyl-CoA synthetase